MIICRNQDGDWLQRTDWHKIVVFRPSTREYVINYLKKGDRALINGRITYNEVVDSEGHNRINTSIIADEIILLQQKSVTTNDADELD